MSHFTSHHSLRKSFHCQNDASGTNSQIKPTLSLHIAGYLWTFGLFCSLAHMQDTHSCADLQVRGPEPLLWQCRRAISERCVGKLHSEKFCIFLFIGFLKSSPHSSHRTAEDVDPVQWSVWFGLKCSFPDKGKWFLNLLNVCLTLGSSDIQLETKTQISGSLLHAWFF